MDASKTQANQNINNVLNQKADPSKVSDKVDQKEVGADDATAKLTQDFDTFLQLLTTQLKHQDPTAPLDTKDFTNQVVMFSQVEQQININKKLQYMISQSDDAVRSQTLGYIGKDIVVEGNQFAFDGTDTSLDYELEKNAREAVLVIKDSSGRKVYESSIPLGKGKNTFKWDGTTSSGKKAEEGEYTFQVSAVDGQKANIAVNHFVSRKVTGVKYQDGEALLETGAKTWSLAKVVSIR